MTALRRLAPAVTLAELVAEPGRAATLSAEAALAFLVQVAPVYAVLQARAASPLRSGGGESRLLRAREAATKLGLTVTALYKQAATLPFTVRHGRALRFNEAGIEAWIRSQQRPGRGA